MNRPMDAMGFEQTVNMYDVLFVTTNIKSVMVEIQVLEEVVCCTSCCNPVKQLQSISTFNRFGCISCKPRKGRFLAYLTKVRPPTGGSTLPKTFTTRNPKLQCYCGKLVKTFYAFLKAGEKPFIKKMCSKLLFEQSGAFPTSVLT